MEERMPYIVCQDLFKTYKGAGLEVVALRGLDLEVMQGEFLGIIGFSGSGKTTLLNVLAGRRDLLNMSESDRVAYRRKEIGFVWQSTSRNLLPYLKAIENVELPMAIMGRSSTERRERAMDLLTTLGLGEKTFRFPNQLSGGEQQRVAIAVALANQPGMVLADEPTGELDTRTADEVLQALQDVCHSYGVTVVVVTHYAGTARFADRVVEIRDGRIVSESVSQRSFRRTGEVVKEEFLVVDKAGRIQLPPESLDKLGSNGRARLSIGPDGVVLKPQGRDE